MSPLLLLRLILAFIACGIGAWLTMAAVILGGIKISPDHGALALRVRSLLAAIRAVFGLLLFIVGTAMIARVLG